MNIAIIPARGGSKRIPRKNIKPFAGKPMIAHAITAAIESGLFEHVVVSTDDDEIASVSKQWGAETPFKRPAELADDFTPTVPVIGHGIQACRELGWVIEQVCCIYPSVPFLQIDDLRQAREALMNDSTHYSFPVTEFPSAIQRALRRQNNGHMQPIYPENETVRTQDLEPAYYDAGQFYWANAKTWLNNTRIHSGGAGHIIPPWRVVDIDTPDDWKRAEHLYQVLNKEGEK